MAKELDRSKHEESTIIAEGALLWHACDGDGLGPAIHAEHRMTHGSTELEPKKEQGKLAYLLSQKVIHARANNVVSKLALVSQVISHTKLVPNICFPLSLKVFGYCPSNLVSGMQSSDGVQVEDQWDAALIRTRMAHDGHAPVCCKSEYGRM